MNWLAKVWLAWVAIAVAVRVQLEYYRTALGWLLRRQTERDLNMVFDSDESIDRVRDLIVLKSTMSKESQVNRLSRFLFDDPSSLWP